MKLYYLSFFLLFLFACSPPSQDKLESTIVGFWEGEIDTNRGLNRWCSEFREDRKLVNIVEVQNNSETSEKEEGRGDVAGGTDVNLDSSSSPQRIGYLMKVQGVWDLAPGKRFRLFGGHKIVDNSVLSDKVDKLYKVDDTYIITDFSDDTLAYRSDDPKDDTVFSMRRVDNCAELEAKVAQLPVVDEVSYE